jgi:hypothetical protein
MENAPVWQVVLRQSTETGGKKNTKEILYCTSQQRHNIIIVIIINWLAWLLSSTRIKEMN